MSDESYKPLPESVPEEIRKQYAELMQDKKNFIYKYAQPQPTFWDYLCYLISFVLCIIIISLVVQLSWNASMPHIFNLPAIDATNALALIILSFVLIKAVSIPIVLVGI